MASREATVFGCVLDAMKWVVNSWQRSLQESLEFHLKFLNQVIAHRRRVVTKSVHFTAPCTNGYVRTTSMFSMCSSRSVVPSYESIWGGFSSPRGIEASRTRRVNGSYALRSCRASQVSSELEGDKERLLRLGGDLRGGDRLGDLFLGDLLR